MSHRARAAHAVFRLRHSRQAGFFHGFTTAGAFAISAFAGTIQRSLYAAELELIGVRLIEASNRVALYKALGGGWQ